MKLFVTKTHGISEPVLPLQFHLESYRKAALGRLSVGDMVAYIGTKGPETAPEQQGRVVGLIKVTRDLVSTLDYIVGVVLKDQEKDREGKYRWPYGIRVSEAWAITEKPELRALSNMLPGRAGITTIIEVKDEELKNTILKLSRKPLAVWEIGTKSATGQPVGRSLSEKWRRRSGPPPSCAEYTVMKDPDSPAETYIFKIQKGTTIAFKIGWSNSPKARMELFQQHALPSLGGVTYTFLMSAKWERGGDAYIMEQQVLRRFKRRASENNEVITGVTEKYVQAVFAEVLNMLLTTDPPDADGAAQDVSSEGLERFRGHAKTGMTTEELMSLTRGRGD